MATLIPLGPAQCDISGIRAGDQNMFVLTITSAGAPVDLTGMEVSASARVKSTDTASVDAVVDVLDAVAGKVSIRWPGEAVRDWMSGKATVNGVWDLQVANTGSDPITVVAGKFGAEMDITR